MSDRQRGNLRFAPGGRACCACGASSRPSNTGKLANVVSISPLLYRRSGFKNRKLRRGANVQVCDDCLAVFITSPSDRRTTLVLTALRDSLSELYNGVLEDMET